MTTAYAELHCISHYTFLRGASSPQELVQRAADLGYQALALTDECSLAGVVKAHTEAKKHKLQLIIGAEFTIEQHLTLVLLAKSKHGYQHIAKLITTARRQADKGGYQLSRKDLHQQRPTDCVVLWFPPDNSHLIDGLWLRNFFPNDLWIAIELFADGHDHRRGRYLQHLAAALSLPLCACGDVHMHDRRRQMLQDTLTAIRLNQPLTALGVHTFHNAERHLQTLATIQQRHRPEHLRATLQIAQACRFSLDEIHYQYPQELIPTGMTASQWLHHLVAQGLEYRWPQGAPAKVHTSVEKELALVQEMHYEPYFLTVYDIVCFARSRGILCQGRGSAANSVICYCLSITEVNPAQMELLFERFISKERNEPPDIDIDFEHERREEVIQYIYRIYGRHRAALAAAIITYRPRSAIRDVGKALGMAAEQVDHLAKNIRWWDGQKLTAEQLTQVGLSADSTILQKLLYLVNQIIRFPRHLSQHVGGFVIAEQPLHEIVPIENAAMPDRTIIQWDKEDLEALGLLKIDILALGMLSAIRKALQMLSQQSQRMWSLASIPIEDPQVYAMMCRADTVGVFQIESRAQMSMLPRLRPQNYYDLVIQIAIVRPGPIQGDMVHPYLTRRGMPPEQVPYPNEETRKILQRTLGVPIFQEQVMQLAMVAAGFTAGEADQLRRSMAAWHRRGGLDQYERKLMQGMCSRGYSQEFARKVFNQIRGFGEYGFPESHSASFALLAYYSAWLKHYHPAVFTCALLNSQPMGFYAPAQLIQDAKRHDVTVLPIDVQHSAYDCTAIDQQQTLRLGLRMVRGLAQTAAERIVQARNEQPFSDVQDLATRCGLCKQSLQQLAHADALRSLAGHRRKAYWQVSGVEKPLPLFEQPVFNEATPLLPTPGIAEQVIADYTSNGFSLQQHPLALLRSQLQQRNIHSADSLKSLPNHSLARVAGIVVGRQRPSTASGVIFVTLEDETGHTNVIVWPSFVEAQRKALLQSTILLVHGTVQQESSVLHLIAGRLQDCSHWMTALQTRSRDFH